RCKRHIGRRLFAGGWSDAAGSVLDYKLESTSLTCQFDVLLAACRAQVDECAAIPSLCHVQLDSNGAVQPAQKISPRVVRYRRRAWRPAHSAGEIGDQRRTG